MFLVVSLCFVLSLCDLTQQATRLIRRKRLIYPDYKPDTYSDVTYGAKIYGANIYGTDTYGADTWLDNANHEGYSNHGNNDNIVHNFPQDNNENDEQYCNEDTHVALEPYGNQGYNGHQGQYEGSHVAAAAAGDSYGNQGYNGYQENTGYNGNNEGNDIRVYSENDGYNLNYEHKGKAGYGASDIAGNDRNIIYNQDENYNTEAHNEAYDPNGKAIAILYAGPDPGTQLHHYGGVQNSRTANHNGGQSNPWAAPILTDDKDGDRQQSNTLGKGAKVDITGIFHKIRLPDFVTDSSNPHEKLQAVKQHLKDNQNVDNAISKDINNGNSSTSSEKSKEKDQINEPSRDEHHDKVHIQVGDNYVKKKENILGGSYSNKNEGDKGYEYGKIPSQSQEKKDEGNDDKNQSAHIDSKEEYGKGYGDNDHKSVSSYNSHKKVTSSSYGAAFDDNSDSEEKEKSSKNQDENMDDDVEEEGSVDEGDAADDDDDGDTDEKD